MKTDHIPIPLPQFRKFAEFIQVMKIVEGQPCYSFKYGKSRFVGTSAIGNRMGTDWSLICCREIVPLSVYNGELNPLPYSKHFQEVDEGKRERCYSGMLITCDGRPAVFTDYQIQFTPVDTGEQTQLF